MMTGTPLSLHLREMIRYIMSVSRTGSLSNRVRKVSKRRLLPGQKLLPDMFGGLFRPKGLPRKEDNEEGIDDVKKIMFLAGE